VQFRAGNAHSTRKRKRCLSATEIEHEAEHRVKRQQEAERHEVALDTEGSTADDTSVTTAKQKPTALRAPSMLSSAADLASISRIGAMPTVEDEEVEALLNTLSVRERESQRVLQAALDLSVQPTFRERSTANRVRLAELSHLVANHASQLPLMERVRVVQVEGRLEAQGVLRVWHEARLYARDGCQEGVRQGACVPADHRCCRCRRGREALALTRPERAWCEQIHFRIIIQPHTDMALGDCSYLDSCRHMKTCKFVHYNIDDDGGSGGGATDESLASSGGSSSLALSSSSSSSSSSVAATPATQQNMEWVCCDVRLFDFSLLGKFDVLLLDPPWDIHMEVCVLAIWLRDRGWSRQCVHAPVLTSLACACVFGQPTYSYRTERCRTTRCVR